jgi:peptidoglycan/xylan/chitin deacetylase (PgdA/CDA1 family)
MWKLMIFVRGESFVKKTIIFSIIILSMFLYDSDRLVNAPEAKSKTTKSESKAVVTFIDDDCGVNFKNTWATILRNKEINISLACISGEIGNGDYLSKRYLLRLQSKGNDILSHGEGGIDTPSSSDIEVDNDFKNGQQWLKENGFEGYEYVVYSGGLERENERIKNIAKKYYKYGVGAWYFNDIPYNVEPVDKMVLSRVNGDTSDLTTLKAAVDGAYENDGWLIVMTHSHLMDWSSVGKISDLIDYVNESQIPIKSFTEAVSDRKAKSTTTK